MEQVWTEVLRILFGEEDHISLLFFGEIVLRTLVMYAYTMVLTRLVGQGGIGQIGPFEFVLVIAVGSAAGDPMFYPDIGLLQGIMVITVVVLAHRAMGFVLSRKPNIEKAVEGVPLTVVVRGKVVEKSIGSGSLTRRELMMLLRQNGVLNTGELELALFEPSGQISLFPAADDASYRGEDTIPSDALPDGAEATPRSAWRQ